MFRWILVCAITAMSAVVADQARAQAANPEPGYCAQFYPNSDCNSIGPAMPGAVAPSPESEPEEAAAPPPPPPKKAAKKQAEKNKKPQTSATVAPPK
jgi:Na+-transporting methylmalonyl-CoA/oxaloacetate decarboxylase gamma subunit